MKKILVVVDMQNDFIDAALGTAEAVAIVPAVKEKILSYPPENVIATMDTHGEDYMDTQEGKNLPVVHCIKGTDGWQIRPDIGSVFHMIDIRGRRELQHMLVDPSPARDVQQRIAQNNAITDDCAALGNVLQRDLMRLRDFLSCNDTGHDLGPGRDLAHRNRNVILRLDSDIYRF